MTAIEIPHQQEIAAAIRRVFPEIRKIFLFGSRVAGRNLNPHADIDIGVIACRRLSLLEQAKLREELDRIDTLYSIDLVDFTDRNDAFAAEALQRIRVLYEKN